jgi:hypothetical protein
VRLEKDNEQIENQFSAQDRINKLAAHPAVANAREHAAAFARTPPVGADLEQVQFAVALISSNEWPDPIEAAQSYWQQVSAIEETAFNKQQSTALQAQATAAKAEAEAARANITAMETSQRLQKAREAAQ